MKISARTANLLFAPAVGLCMSLVMSFALTWINLGISSPAFLTQWLQSFGISFLVAVPIAWLVVPRIRSLLDSMTEEPNPPENQPAETSSGEQPAPTGESK